MQCARAGAMPMAQRPAAMQSNTHSMLLISSEVGVHQVVLADTLTTTWLVSAIRIVLPMHLPKP